MDADRYQEHGCDTGFTLVEMLIVITTMVIITGTIAAVVTVVLRTTPPTEVRTNDARALQGLVTWLPQDVDATPPDGFSTADDPTAWHCSGPPPSGHNILSLSWTETTSVALQNAAAYRYEQVGTEWRMARYVCDDGGTGTFGPARRINLTSALPAWDPIAKPTFVEMCATNPDVNGNCPAGQKITTPTSPHVQSIKMTVARLDGVTTTLDAAPKNPDQNLGDDPDAIFNQSPTVTLPANHLVQMYAGDTLTIDLPTDTHWNPTDPEGKPLSVAIDYTEPIPAGITPGTIDPLGVTLAASPGLPAGVIPQKLYLVISDDAAGWVAVTMTIEIIPEPNQPPQLGTNPYHLVIPQGSNVILPIDVTHAVTDPNGDPLNLTAILSQPLSMALNPPQIGGSLGPMELMVRAAGGAPLGPTLLPIVVRVSDGRGGSVDATVTVEVVSPAPNQPPTASPTSVNVSMYAGETKSFDLATSHGVSDPDGDPLSVALDAAVPAGMTVDFPSALGVEITADLGLLPGPVASPIKLQVVDIDGNDVHVEFLVEIIPTPPPPSDCVLGTLTASPNPIGRQGNGIGARHLKDDVTVTVTYSGTCDGLVLTYETGDTSGLGVGVGRVFPAGSPSSIKIYSSGNGGTEKWLAGPHVLTATTTSVVAPNSVTTTLDVN